MGLGILIFFPWETQGRSVYQDLYWLSLSLVLVAQAWRMYLRLRLRSQGLDAVSWYDMPSLVRRAGSRERRLLTQWRLATMAQAILLVVLLLGVAALITTRLFGQG